MKKQLLIVLLLIMCSLPAISQGFDRIPIKYEGEKAMFKLNGKDYVANFSVNPLTRAPRIMFTGNRTFTYNSIYPDGTLSFEIFGNEKSNSYYLLVNNYYDMSRGADVYIIDRGRFFHQGFLNVAAYNSSTEGGEDLNYNSILPFLTVVRTTEKTYFSFETPLVVTNPGHVDEEIYDSPNIHFTLEKGKFVRNITK